MSKHKLTQVNWIECDGNLLPDDGDRVLFYRKSKLTKIGEMVYRENEKQRFLEINDFWAPELYKPE